MMLVIRCQDDGDHNRNYGGHAHYYGEHSLSTVSMFVEMVVIITIVVII